uniref:Uncharacterized protein n=1 Tax=Aegilops tauschii TaxID=37682 RepID=N1R146_AEGTA
MTWQRGMGQGHRAGTGMPTAAVTTRRCRLNVVKRDLHRAQQHVLDLGRCISPEKAHDILHHSGITRQSDLDILRSSLKIGVLRYTDCTLKRLPSAEYMTQWPLTAIEVHHSSSSLAVAVSLFLLSTTILCYLFAN